MRGIGPIFFGRAYALFTSLFTFCSLPSLHAGQLEKWDPTDQGHCKQGTSGKKRALKMSPGPNVSMCGHICSVGGKFCDTRVNYENNEN